MSAKQLKKHGQMSDTFINAIFLTLSGGFQDAYTYCFRDEVFANAQTGNIVLMSSYLFQGKWSSALRYFIPLCFFISGIFCAEVFHRHFKNMSKFHWRQIILIAEIALLFAVGFIPQSLNILANSVISFVCAMQVQVFRKVNGHAYASTMCIGNMRSGTEALCIYVCTKNKEYFYKATEYYGIILFFAIGAGFGSIITGIFGAYAIFISCLLLTVSFCIMFVKRNAIKNQANFEFEKNIDEHR